MNTTSRDQYHLLLLAVFGVVGIASAVVAYMSGNPKTLLLTSAMVLGVVLAVRGLRRRQ